MTHMVCGTTFDLGIMINDYDSDDVPSHYVIRCNMLLNQWWYGNLAGTGQQCTYMFSLYFSAAYHNSRSVPEWLHGGIKGGYRNRA